MKKISFLFSLFSFLCAGAAGAATRSDAVQRAPAATQTRAAATAVQSRAATTESRVSPRGEPRAAPTAGGSARSAAAGASAARIITNSPPSPASRALPPQGGETEGSAVRALPPRRGEKRLPVAAVSRSATTARAAETTAIANTKTGTEYERCKTAYFACMDQFCAIKNSNYQRCSCSDKIYDLEKQQTVLTEAGVQLTSFTENLDIVGMTAAQATAMKKASEGENALTNDASASKALLQAIMNSIKGEDANVGGKFADLNSMNLSMDTSMAFGMGDSGQAIAAYNGKNLYTAIYGTCRQTIKDDCSDAALQRAITAYLMAIENDCSVVQRQLTDNQKKLTNATREGGAMLNLARIENRQNHNSSTMTECLRNVESAVLSEEVCGADYHRCLDNGEFIDITTGKPIVGVIEFYNLGKLLKFAEDISIADQHLSRVQENRRFVDNFEKRVKKFAAPALDKCAENADLVWADYLDKAMLDIYYAQKSKVDEIKRGCFEFVNQCYVSGEKSITTAMSGVLSDAVLLQPELIALTDKVCKDYVDSCDNMFNDGTGIVAQYVAIVSDKDTMTACRAIVQQCFDQFGGTNYENLYHPNSGLFKTGEAIKDWFTIESPCYKQMSEIAACQPIAMEVFGGAKIETWDEYDDTNLSGRNAYKEFHMTGVATEVYQQIINHLTIQCNNIFGNFIAKPHLPKNSYLANQPCISTFNKSDFYKNLIKPYKIGFILQGTCTGTCTCIGTDTGTCTGSGHCNCTGDTTNIDNYNNIGMENMCPMDYWNQVDTQSWGACLCWENGGRRSQHIYKFSSAYLNLSSQQGTLTIPEHSANLFVVGGVVGKCIPPQTNHYTFEKPYVAAINHALKVCPGDDASGNPKQCTNGVTVPISGTTINNIDQFMELVPPAIVGMNND